MLYVTARLWCKSTKAYLVNKLQNKDTHRLPHPVCLKHSLNKQTGKSHSVFMPTLIT